MAQESWNRDKEETGCKVPKGLILCANNCGLFGSPATMNLCSKCYRDLKHSFPQGGGDSAAAFRSDAVPALALNEERAGPSSSSGAISSQKPLVTEATRQTMNRCTTCRKKVGLTGFRCRCGHMFCGLHRYSDKHGCSFDYKAFGRAAIAKANPVVKADKVIRF